jgi:serine/threonine protein phosphatase PrpC
MASAPIRSCDVAIVLASDGLWEVAKNDEVVPC